MAWIRTGTLLDEDIVAVTLPERHFSSIEVMNVAGTATITFRVLNERDADEDVQAWGDDCEILPAVVCALQVNAPDDAPLVVKMIADGGDTTYSIRAE